MLGWYDYIYGSPYCLPRVWFHQMAGDYRFGYANGVRAMYAEAYPNWGEGPKLYVSLKLQWDPRQDVDALLRDWYVRAVGPDAAGDLAAYYAHWEDFWTRRIRDSRWFSKTGQYLAFYNPAYLADVSEEEIAHCRTLLERDGGQSPTGAQKARAKLLLRAFEYYEASVYAYGGQAGPAGKTGGDKPEPPSVPASEAARLAAHPRGNRCLQMARRRQRLVDEFTKDPVLVHPLGGKTLPQLGGQDWGAGLFWRGAGLGREERGGAAGLHRLAESPEPWRGAGQGHAGRDRSGRDADLAKFLVRGAPGPLARRLAALDQRPYRIADGRSRGGPSRPDRHPLQRNQAGRALSRPSRRSRPLCRHGVDSRPAAAARQGDDHLERHADRRKGQEHGRAAQPFAPRAAIGRGSPWPARYRWRAARPIASGNCGWW